MSAPGGFPSASPDSPQSPPDLLPGLEDELSSTSASADNSSNASPQSGIRRLSRPDVPLTPPPASGRSDADTEPEPDFAADSDDEIVTHNTGKQHTVYAITNPLNPFTDDEKPSDPPVLGRQSSPNFSSTQGSHVWEVKNFPQLRQQCWDRYESDPFELMGFQWRLLLFPNGSATDRDHVACYLALLTPVTAPHLFHFRFVMLHATEPSKNQLKESEFHFTSTQSDRGFSSLLHAVELPEFIHHDKDNALCIRVDVWKPDDSATNYTKFMTEYNSKEATGYVGLKNQGATCYMNSMLQTLFHLPIVRHYVYSMPWDTEGPDGKPPAITVAHALQRVFWTLQTGSNAASTKQLTNAFGWKSAASFIQHDVQEFSQVLIDNLDEKMKKMKIQIDGKTVAQLFEGQSEMFIECCNVPYKSSRVETYQNLALNVKGLGSIEKSFENYTEVETLEGKNQYRAENYGLQDAKKGTRFQTFPPILQLQLKRFEYDYMSDAMKKVNERFEFPATLDLAKFLEHLPEDKRPPSLYVLHSVLVHAGSVSGGHYYNYVRPIRKRRRGDEAQSQSALDFYSSCPWFKFDDETVTAVTAQEAIEGNFGGDKLGGYRSSSANAYMLVYLSSDVLQQWANQVADETEEDAKELPPAATVLDVPVPPALNTKFQAELEEQKAELLKKQRAHLYTDLHLVSDVALQLSTLSGNQNLGTELTLSCYSASQRSIVYENTPPSIHILKSSTIGSLGPEIEKVTSIPADQQQIWRIIVRNNKTSRPSALLADPTVSVLPDSVHEDVSYFIRSTADDQDPEVTELIGSPSYPLVPGGSALLLLKYFDIEQQRLVYLGSALVSTENRVHGLMEYVKLMMKRKGLINPIALRKKREFIRHRARKGASELDSAESSWAAYQKRMAELNESTAGAESESSGELDYNLQVWEEEKAVDSKIPRLLAEQFIADTRLNHGDCVVFQVAFDAVELQFFEDSHRMRYEAYEETMRSLVRGGDTKGKSEAELSFTGDFYASVPEYLRYLSNRFSVQFSPNLTVPAAKGPQSINGTLPFTLELDGVITVPRLAQRVASIIGTDSQKLLFYRHSSYNKGPDNTPIDKYLSAAQAQTQMLSDLIEMTEPILYYSLSDYSASDLASNYSVDIIHADRRLQYSKFQYLVPKHASFFELQQKCYEMLREAKIKRLNQLKESGTPEASEEIEQLVQTLSEYEEFLSPANAGEETIRCRRVFLTAEFMYPKFRIFRPLDAVQTWKYHSHSPDGPLLIEEIPPEETESDNPSTETPHFIFRFVPLAHSQYRLYSAFTILIKQGETLSDFIVRLWQRLGIDPAKETERISKIKVARLTANAFHELGKKKKDKPAADGEQPDEKGDSEEEYPYLIVNHSGCYGIAIYDPVDAKNWETLTGDPLPAPQSAASKSSHSDGFDYFNRQHSIKIFNQN